MQHPQWNQGYPGPVPNQAGPGPAPGQAAVGPRPLVPNGYAAPGPQPPQQYGAAPPQRVDPNGLAFQQLNLGGVPPAAPRPPGMALHPQQQVARPGPVTQPGVARPAGAPVARGPPSPASSTTSSSSLRGPSLVQPGRAPGIAVPQQQPQRYGTAPAGPRPSQPQQPGYGATQVARPAGVPAQAPTMLRPGQPGLGPPRPAGGMPSPGTVRPTAGPGGIGAPPSVGTPMGQHPGAAMPGPSPGGGPQLMRPMGAGVAGPPPSFMAGGPATGVLPPMGTPSATHLAAPPMSGLPSPLGSLGGAAAIPPTEVEIVELPAPGQAVSHPAAAASGFPRPAGPGAEEAVSAPASYSASNPSPGHLRFSTQAIPASQSLRGRWHLPLGAVLAPMSEAGGQVPLVDMGAAGIVRCARCRTYINPHVAWLDGGRSFSCNVCSTVNQTPVEYFATLDASGKRVDLDQRPELSSGTVEYVAPAEYMVRAPQPPSYVFVIDVSFPAVSSGMLASVCSTIRENLDSFHGDSRTQVGFVTFDSAVHYYSLKPGASAPTMHVVADVDELFVPLPDELLGNLVECRGAVEALLDSLPKAWARATAVDSATGPALQAAFLVMGHVGGKMMLFQAAPPSVGIGRLRTPTRDNPAVYGTDREYSLRVPDDPFYKRFAAECSRCHICVDVFAFGSTYLDLASLGAMPKYLGGQIYAYPHFQAARDGPRLKRELKRNLSRETGWEAVMRIRCSKGLRVTSFFGHFFIRTTDLLSLPVVDADKAFSVEIAHDESVLTGQTAFVQSALLYTASNGERRIRVHTAALPVVNDIAEMYKAIDAGATLALLGKAAVERSLASRLEDVRASTQHRLLLALREFRTLLGSRGGNLSSLGSGANALVLPRRARALPALCMGLLKTAALRGGGRDVSSDERAVTAAAIVSGPVEAVVKLAYPAVYDVGGPTDASVTWGGHGSGSNTTTSTNGAPPTEITLPSTVPAGVPYCNPSSAYLIDNGRVCVLWLGASLGNTFYERVFGSPAAASADPATLNPEPVRPGSDLSARLNAVLHQLRQGHELSQPCWVIRQGTPQEALIAPLFVEDPLPGSGAPGFLDYMQVLQRDVLSK